MSDEKHDQNKGLETPDTAPSIMRVIAYGIMGYLLVACIGGFFFYGIDVSDNGGSQQSDDASQVIRSAQSTGGFSPSAYFSDSNSLGLISEQISLGNLHVAADQAELATVLGTFPEIRIIFIDPSVLENEAYVTLLKSHFEAGKMIVGLRTSHALLSQKLGLSPQAAELSLDEKTGAVVWISGWYLDEDGEPAEIVQAWDQYPSMLTNLHILSQTVRP